MGLFILKTLFFKQKLMLLLLGQLWEKFGLLFILTLEPKYLVTILQDRSIPILIEFHPYWKVHRELALKIPFLFRILNGAKNACWAVVVAQLVE